MAFTGAIGLGDLLAAGAADVGGLTLAGEAGAFGAGIDAASAAALAAGGAGLAGEAGAFGAGTDVAGLSAADLAAAGGGLGLAGEAGAFGAGAAPAAAIPTVAGAAPIAAGAPELALPGSSLPASAGLSATSATPSFASELATTPDAFAGWGGGSTTGLAGQSADLGFPAGGQGFSGIPPQGIGTTPASGITGGGSDLAFAGPPAGTQTASGISVDALSAATPASSAASPAAAVAPPAAPPAAGAASPAAAATSPTSATPAATGIVDWIKANPMMAASLGLGGGMIAKNAISPQKIPQENQLTGLAAQAQALSAQNQSLEQQLLAPLTTGQLPPAQQAQVQQAVQDAVTAIKSKYASMGMSGSTVEQDAINNAQNQGVQLAGTIAEQMAQTGLSAGQNAASALNISGTIYAEIMNAQISQDNALQAAIAAFAGQAAIGAGISATKKA